MLWESLIFVSFITVKCNEVNIGGLFEENSDLVMAYNAAIKHSKNRKTEDDDYTFSAIAKNITNDPFQNMQDTCQMLENGIVAIIGPKYISNIDIVQSVCDTKEIPHLVTGRENRSRGGTEVSLYPHQPLLCRAYWQIIETLKWNRFTILYEDNGSLLHITDLIKTAKANGVVTNLMQLDSTRNGNYRDTFKKIKELDQKFIVIDCHIDNLSEVMKQLQQVGLINENYNYFITNLDAHTIDLTPFWHSGANITGIRLLNPESPYVQTLVKDLFPDVNETISIEWSLKTEQALVIDAINIFFDVLNYNRRKIPVPLVDGSNSLSCKEGTSWKYGYTLVNNIKTKTFEGLTGLIKFSPAGFRTDFTLWLYEFMEGGIPVIGNWSSSSGLFVNRIHQNIDSNSDSMRNKTFIVQITLTEPYGMLKVTTKKLHGNDRYEGFVVDLIEKLAQIEGFNYTLVLREDKSNGAYNATTKKWSGMIGDLLEGKTDMAATDFTITAAREDAVDFTDPFMTLGITILFKKPQNAPPSFFSFADPFAFDTWIALAVSFFVVSFSLFIIGRICAEEWNNPYPCIEEPEYLSNQFSLWNSIWFTTGSLMCQGSEIAPIAMSTRMLAGWWWFFCLIMVASYTANLAAFLATENPVELFKDIESLYENRHKIKFGAKADGATLNFFESNTESIFQKVHLYMKAHPENPKTNEEGVARVESTEENFAFFMESTSIEYTTQRHCGLKQYGKNLDEKGYGIALKKNSPYRQRLSSAILQLQSSQWIDNTKRKWWEERRGGGQCVSGEVSGDADPLKLVNVEGCFWVTIYGTCIAAGLVIIEHLFYVLKVSKKYKISYKEAFMQELRSYMEFNSNIKPVGSRESLDKSETHSEKNDDDKHKGTRSKSPDLTKSMITYRPNLFQDSSSNGNNGDTNSVERPYGFVVNISKERLHTSL